MHSPTLKQEFEQQFGHFTSLFDMPSASDVAADQYSDFAAATTTSSNHMRTISSESGSSSTIDQVLPRPTHPSIAAFKQRDTSPEGYISLVSHSHPHRSAARRFDPIGTRPPLAGTYTVTPARTKRTVVLSDEEDDVEDLEPLRKGATEQERIEHKRRLNTLAARRSRRRRATELLKLQETVGKLEQECTKWKTRSMMLRGILDQSGINTPTFDD